MKGRKNKVKFLKRKIYIWKKKQLIEKKMKDLKSSNKIDITKGWGKRKHRKKEIMFFQKKWISNVNFRS